MQTPETNPRSAKPLPALEGRLKAYALAAAGIGLATPSAAAKILYTPADKVLTSGTFTLPLENQGRFTFFDGFKSQSLSGRNLSVRPLAGGAVMVNGAYAQALGTGASIGPNGAFRSQAARMEFVEFLSDSSRTQAYGPWANVSNRYVGLKFVIDGQTHYGWARLSVSNFGSITQGVKIKATLTGYAVETIANRAIPAGKTSGPESQGLAEAPVSLGCLALGCAGIALRQPDK
jgi:hypothetical protein